MSKTFLQAHSAGHYDFELAIKLYNQEIENNDPKNFAAYNNRGVAKVHKAISENNKTYAEQGLEDFKKAIELANEYDKKKRFLEAEGYQIAEKNILWANEVIAGL